MNPNVEQGCLFYTAKEVMKILGVSRAKAYKTIKLLNAELLEKGYIIIAGKIPQKYLAERVYGMTV